MDTNLVQKFSKERKNSQLDPNELPKADLARIKCSVHFETLEGIRRHVDRIGERAEARETERSTQTDFKTEDLSNVSDITQGIGCMEIAPGQYLKQDESGAVGKIKRKTLSNPSYFPGHEASTSKFRSTGFGDSVELPYFPGHEASTSKFRSTGFGDSVEFPSSLISEMRSLDINQKQRFNESKRNTVSRKGRNKRAVMKYQRDLPRRDSRRAVEFNRSSLYSMNPETRELDAPCLCGLFSAQPIRYHGRGLRRSNSFTVAPLDLSVRASRRSSVTATSQNAEPEGVIYPSERYGQMADGR